MTRALVIGNGSIGRRHARLLAQAGCDVAVVTRRPGEGQRCHADIAEGLAAEQPDYVVIANETARHHEALAALTTYGYAGIVLIEKPLFDKPRAVPRHGFRHAAVAYNLRFHPVLMELARRLDGHRVLSVEAYVGQWLPDWRPGTDYRTSYSADPARGGGVLRDLSHELDTIAWLFGPWSRVAALGGKCSDLEIATDDLWTVLIEMESGAAVTLQLNYLDRPGRRRMLVITSQSTFVADLSAGTLTENGATAEFKVARDHTYEAEHGAMIAGGAGRPCSLEEGLDVLATVAAIERAAASRSFVTRGALA